MLMQNTALIWETPNFFNDIIFTLDIQIFLYKDKIQTTF